MGVSRSLATPLLEPPPVGLLTRPIAYRGAAAEGRDEYHGEDEQGDGRDGESHHQASPLPGCSPGLGSITPPLGPPLCAGSGLHGPSPDAGISRRLRGDSRMGRPRDGRPDLDPILRLERPAPGKTRPLLDRK